MGTLYWTDDATLQDQSFEKMLVKNFDHDSERDFHFFTGSSLGDSEKKQIKDFGHAV